MRAENTPLHKKYGRSSEGKKNEINCKEAYQIFKKQYNLPSDMKQLNK